MTDHLKDGKGKLLPDENAESLSLIRNCEDDFTCVYESYDLSATEQVLNISAKCIDNDKLSKPVISTRLLQLQAF